MCHFYPVRHFVRRDLRVIRGDEVLQNEPSYGIVSLPSQVVNAAETGHISQHKHKASWLSLFSLYVTIMLV